MSKHKKKRNKIYTGEDAAITRPVITRVSAVNRSQIGQWWFDRKKTLKPVLITAGVVIFLILMIIEIIRIANGSTI